jgi:hypothetical protein
MTDKPVRILRDGETFEDAARRMHKDIMDQESGLTPEQEAFYRKSARETYVQGSNEDVAIDENAKFSVADNGVWVGGWMWVSMPLCNECDEPYHDLVPNDIGYCPACLVKTEAEICPKCADETKPLEVWAPDSHWDDHPVHLWEDWVAETQAGATRQSYIAWVNSRLEAAYMEAQDAKEDAKEEAKKEEEETPTGFVPHASHDMTDWRGTTVTLLETSRFGEIRKCRACGAEEAKTAAGEAHHDELEEECPSQKKEDT